MRLARRWRIWREQSLYNRAMELISRDESYWRLAMMDLPKIGILHARRKYDVSILQAPMETGITGMYD